MRKVALLKLDSQNRGGLEKYTKRISTAFLERGDDLTFLSSDRFKLAQWPSSLRMEQYDRAVQNWLKQHPVDLIFGMDRNRIQTHIRAGNGVHAAYLKSRIHTEGRWKQALCKINPLHRKILELEKAGFENPSLQRLFTNSHMVRQEILDHYQVDPKKIEVIHNGVEWKEMEPFFSHWQEGRKRVLAQYGLDEGKYHFLFVGHGYLRKGLDRLLEALPLLPFRDFHLSVIGKDKRINFYREKASKLGLKEKVRFFGPLHPITPFYQLADALVIPSFYDPFANVTIEALAMGLFVVSSRCNGGSEILTNQNGWVIENLLDLSAIVEGLMQAVKRPKTEHSAQIARKSVERLDFSFQMKQLMDLL